MNEHEQKELRDRFERAGQGHVFAYLDQNGSTLSAEEQSSFWKQFQSIDVQRIRPLIQKALEAEKQSKQQQSSSSQEDNDVKIKALDADRIGHVTSDNGGEVASWREQGLRAVVANEVAALVLAGGQGTRLGFAGPKGMFDIGLPSAKSLFQLASRCFN